MLDSDDSEFCRVCLAKTSWMTRLALRDTSLTPQAYLDVKAHAIHEIRSARPTGIVI